MSAASTGDVITPTTWAPWRTMYSMSGLYFRNTIRVFTLEHTLTHPAKPLTTPRRDTPHVPRASHLQNSSRDMSLPVSVTMRLLNVSPSMSVPVLHLFHLP